MITLVNTLAFLAVFKTKVVTGIGSTACLFAIADMHKHPLQALIPSPDSTLILNDLTKSVSEADYAGIREAALETRNHI